MSHIANQLFAKNNIKIALIGDETALTKSAPLIIDFHERIKKDATRMFGLPEIEIPKEIPKEGWATSTTVSFVAGSFKTVSMNHEDAPAISVISRMLRSLFLHREIREKGGAYGGFANYSPENGVFHFASYRDPHIASTLNTYSKAYDFIRSGDYTETDINEAILQICSDIDKPDPPGPAARNAFYRKIIGLTDDMRKIYKKRVLAVDRKKVKLAAEKYFNRNRGNDATVVISNEESIIKANEKTSGKKFNMNRI